MDSGKTLKPGVKNIIHESDLGRVQASYTLVAIGTGRDFVIDYWSVLPHMDEKWKFTDEII